MSGFNDYSLGVDNVGNILRKVFEERERCVSHVRLNWSNSYDPIHRLDFWITGSARDGQTVSFPVAEIKTTAVLIGEIVYGPEELFADALRTALVGLEATARLVNTAHVEGCLCEQCHEDDDDPFYDP